MTKNFVLEQRVNYLIALCHIKDDYVQFNQNLKAFMSKGKCREKIYILSDIMKGKKVLFSRKYKRFYDENKEVLDTIKKYTNIYNFVNFNYDLNGDLVPYCSLDNWYNYIKRNEEDMDKIISVLNQIRKLGIDVIYFDESLDFTKERYKMHEMSYANFEISYLDNMEAIPSYQDIDYVTKDSNYKIIVTTSFNEIEKYGRKIILNSLVFDSKRLPEILTKKTIIDKILNLKNEEAKEEIKNSIDLSVSIDDIYSQIKKTSRVMEKINNSVDMDDLHKALNEVRSKFQRLKDVSDDHNKEISKKNKKVTKNVLDKEKKMYLKRRVFSRVDTD